MDRSMTQALTGLIPTLTGSLPPELFELAVSLLAQSRSKASSLKADEEIARSYACANLACERLKQSFNLPKIEPRPPCPPKVYQKLYRYLDSALPAGTRRNVRLSRQTSSVSTPQSSPAKPRTPARKTSLRPDTRQKKTPQNLSTSSTEAPVWLMPVIRQLCNDTGAFAAPHHIFAGVSSIFASQRQQVTISVQALIVAVYLLVTTRLSGIETAPDKYKKRRDTATDIVNDAGRNDGAYMEISSLDIDNCMREVKDQKWTQMDWFRNITQGAGFGMDKPTKDDAEDRSHDDEADKDSLLHVTGRTIDSGIPLEQDFLQAGLGTMMRDQVDYLSDRKRREYQVWKRDILIHIERLKSGQEMDVGPG